MASNRRHFLKHVVLGSLGFSTAGKVAASQQPTEPSQSDIFEIIRQRRSVRKFKNTPVPEAHIHKILEAGNYAPTPRNRQAWKFLVIKNRKTIDKIKEAGFRSVRIPVAW